MYSDRIVESVKRRVIEALKSVFGSEHPDQEMRNISVDMEYPDKRADYPAIFVQFSLKTLESADIGQMFQDEEGRRVILWKYTGTVTLTVLALRSRSRDRISGSIINTYAFGRLKPETNKFYTTLADAEDLAIAINSGQLTPMGQSTSVGAPWDDSPTTIVYEDAYSFNIQGEFASDFDTEDVIPLRAIEVYARQMGTDEPGYMHVGRFDTPPTPGQWL